MITIPVDNYDDISQEIYDDILKGVSICSLKCPICKSTGFMKRFGFYTRKMKRPDGEICIRVQRVLCAACSPGIRTHAIMLSSMVPYSQFSLAEHAAIAEAYEGHTSYGMIMDKNPEIDMNYILHMLRTYVIIWRNKLRVRNISLKFYGLLAAGCLSHYSMQFMQTKGTPNILYLPSA